MKPSHLDVLQSIPLNFELVGPATGEGSWTNSLCCTACRAPLNLHQPDEEKPSQLLGTCDVCSRWFFLVESELDWEGTLLFELPSAETIRAALGGPRGGALASFLFRRSLRLGDALFLCRAGSSRRVRAAVGGRARALAQRSSHLWCRSVGAACGWTGLSMRLAPR